MKYNENNNIITMDIENAILHVLAMMRNVHHPFLVGRRRYNTDVRVKDINVGFFFFSNWERFKLYKLPGRWCELQSQLNFEVDLPLQNKRRIAYRRKHLYYKYTIIQLSLHDSSHKNKRIGIIIYQTNNKYINTIVL